MKNTTTNKRRRWTRREEAFLKKHAARKSARNIAYTLNRSYSALRIRAGSLGILLTSRLQKPGKYHEFPCGCSGFLPRKRGESNMFAKSSQNHRTRSWICRILQILRSSKHAAWGKYRPIKATHLVWIFGRGSTPHLHHDHDTGKVFGFTHSICNPRALQKEIVRLKKHLDNPDRL